MRVFILLLISVLGQFACSPVTDKHTNTVSSDTSSHAEHSAISADTIEIWDDFASEPFLFRNWDISLDSLLMFLPSHVELEGEVTPSEFHDNANDSITKIKLGQSIIKFVKTPSAAYIEYAVVTESEIQFQKNIRIGDSYKDICEKFPDAIKDTKPFQKIYINAGEATNTLIMEFKDNKLYKVTFWPYVG